MDELQELYCDRRECIGYAIAFSICLIGALVGFILAILYRNLASVAVLGFVLGASLILSAVSIYCAVSTDREIKRLVMSDLRRKPNSNRKKLG